MGSAADSPAAGSAGGGSNFGAVASSRIESSMSLDALRHGTLRVEGHGFNLVANSLHGFFQLQQLLAKGRRHLRQTLTIQENPENCKYQKPLKPEKLQESQRQDHDFHLSLSLQLFRG